MWKYKKINQKYWLKKSRISNDKKFTKKRKVDKTRIVQKILKETMIYTFLIFIFFIFLGFYYDFSILYIIWLFFFVLWLILKFYFSYKNKKLFSYKRITNLQKMDPRDFEEYITEMFNKIGFKVKTTSWWNDKWADSIWKDKNWYKIIIQTKRYSDKTTIWSPTIRNFVGSMSHYWVKRWYIVTTWYFTKEAIFDIKKEKDFKIIPVDKDRLTELIDKAYKI